MGFGALAGQGRCRRRFRSHIGHSDRSANGSASRPVRPYAADLRSQGSETGTEDPIAHSELSALTRRYEETAQKTDREFGIVKSDLTALRLQVGNLDQKVDSLGDRIHGLEQKIDGFLTEQRTVNTTLVELLTGLVGKNPGTA
ncbi:hypothetical protein ACFWBV_30665 [Streptomyces sp. NPDC060030]|uniref:hypothetical protein n=1 Tax=Streptomyces sp. NPDC060030 TaxID=3347042 RepID=UPI0036CF962C